MKRLRSSQNSSAKIGAATAIRYGPRLVRSPISDTTPIPIATAGIAASSVVWER